MIISKARLTRFLRSCPQSHHAYRILNQRRIPMAKRKARRSAPRRRAASYSRSSPRRRSRRNTLNASTKKKLAGLGMAAGVATVAAPVAISAIKSRSIAPITSAATNINVWKTAALRAGGGYVGGTIAGIVIDKTGLKRPVNKALKLVGMR